MERDGLMLGVALHLLRTEDGGRQTAVICEREAAYRPNWSRNTPDPQHQTGAPVLMLRPSIVEPGGSARAVLWPMYEPEWMGVSPGDRLYMFEGTRLCGEADVLAVWPRGESLDGGSRKQVEAWVQGDD
jgi:hypothetical protein